MTESHMLIEKHKRLRDRKYLDEYAHATCLVCGSDYGVIGAHIREGHEGGLGLKPDDDLTLPLCFRHHAEQTASPGPQWWIEHVFPFVLMAADAGWKLDQVKSLARQRYQDRNPEGTSREDVDG